MQMLEYTADIQDIGKRMDKFLAEKNNLLSRSALADIAENGGVSVNGQNVGKKYKLKQNDAVILTVPDPVEYEAVPEDIPLDIVYEDSDLLVVNKPKGMVVHPATGNYTGTLVNALLFHCKDSLSGINGIMRPGIVHRIDKNTSGLLIVAKNDHAHKRLAEQISVHSFKREYQAVVYGTIKENGKVDAPIGRNKNDRKKMCVTYDNSKPAVTHYEVIRSYSTAEHSYTHIKCILETGRTHQIRVHMAYIGHPVAGDDVYGPKKVIKSLNGQCLHAKTIGFVHPSTGEYMEFTTELPQYFTAFLNKIG